VGVHEPRRNIEFKAIDPDPARSASACLALGAADEGFLRQTDTYFEVHHGHLKLREEDERAWLIYYERCPEAIARESRYFLLDVSDPVVMKDALAAALGVRIAVKKVRRLFLVRNVRIHLDRVVGLGDFIEIEAVAQSDSDLTDEHSFVRELQEALGIASSQIVEWGYAERLLTPAT